MKNFNYINREVVNPIDLNTLGKTYNTLEQGHQEAVKAASELEISMASLDLNEAESQWRQGKLAEIRQTIDDNTNYGNAYSALDDIIAKAGNIASDQGMIGRLQAQKDYKGYRDNLDKRNDIPEAYKEMFREQNGYHYQDTVDEKTGTVIGGTKWEPTTRPVSTVDHFSVMTKALGIAAKESGGGSNVTFLDANGNPTSDARKSATGEMYMKTSGSYQRLTGDKIRSAINSAMASTPGAKESLEQDYKFSNWSHEKKVKANEGKPFYEEGVTDKFGNILDFNHYVDKKVTPFVNAAKYNNYQSDVQVGTALQTRRAQQAVAAASMGATDQPIPLKSIIPANTVGKFETEVDNYSTSVINKNAANKNALDIIGKFGGKPYHNVSEFINDMKGTDKVFGPGLAVNKYIQRLQASGVKLTNDDKASLTNAVKGYVSYNTEQKKLENSVGAEDRKALRFGDSVSRNEYTAGKSKWDDAIINANNNLFSKNDRIDINMTPELTKNLIKQFGVSNVAELGLTSTVDDDGNTVVSFSPNDRNMLPQFMSNLDKADNVTTAGWRARGNFIKGRGFREYNIENQAKNGAYSFGERQNVSVRTVMDSMIKNYNNGIEKSASVQKKAGVQRGILSIEGTAKNNFKQIEIDNKYNLGQIDATNYNLQTKAAKEDVDAMFASGDFNAGSLYVADASNNFTKNIESNEIGALVSYMYQKHPDNITRNATIPSGITDSRRGNNIPLKGYVLNFTVPANATETGLKKYAGQSFKIMYGGGMKESINTDPALAVSNVVTNIYNTSKATNTPATVTPYHNALGSTDVTFNKGQVNINFLGSTIPSNEKVALEYMKNIHTLDDLKSTVKNGMVADKNKFIQGISTVVNNLSNYTGKDPKLVETAVLNYLNQ